MKRFLGLVVLLFNLTAHPSTALELTGFADLALGHATYPAANFIYDAGERQSANLDLRLLAEAGDGVWHFSANLLESAGSLVPLTPALAAELPMEVERSSLLTWEQHRGVRCRAALGADILQLQYRGRRLDLALGRQPVSLATTFYFSPNDFFAPFAAQSFFLCRRRSGQSNAE